MRSECIDGSLDVLLSIIINNHYPTKKRLKRHVTESVPRTSAYRRFQHLPLKTCPGYKYSGTAQDKTWPHYVAMKIPAPLRSVWCDVELIMREVRRPQIKAAVSMKAQGVAHLVVGEGVLQAVWQVRSVSWSQPRVRTLTLPPVDILCPLR